MFKESIRTKSFSKNWNRAGLDDDELEELETSLFKEPKSGDIIKETGGIRKVRWSRPGQGKSGGVRVFYYCVLHDVLYLLACILKNEDDNLSKQERNALAKILKALEVQRKMKGKNS